MTLRHLTMVNGQVGLLVRDQSTFFSGEPPRRDRQRAGRSPPRGRLRAVRAEHVSASFNGGNGITVSGVSGSVADSDLFRNTGSGLALTDSGAATVESNDIYANGGYGVFVLNRQVVADRDRPRRPLPGPRQPLHDNLRSGISAGGNVLVAGNAISGHTNPAEAGISLAGGEALRNVVHRNATGISGVGAVTANRVHDNSGVGVAALGGHPVRENVVYANAIGVLVQGSTALSNNVVYSNTLTGIRLRGPASIQLVNNTVYQPLGDAVVVEGASVTAQVRNNVLWAQAGYAVSVATESQSGFTSDYNVLHVTGTGKVGFWQGAARPTFASWQNASFTDQNSLGLDPLFVNAAAGDFHEQSLHGSFHGGSLAPALDAGTGLPAFPTAVETTDAAQSPAIDRGAPPTPSPTSRHPTAASSTSAPTATRRRRRRARPSTRCCCGRPAARCGSPAATSPSAGAARTSSATVRHRAAAGHRPSSRVIADAAPNNGEYLLDDPGRPDAGVGLPRPRHPARRLGVDRRQHRRRSRSRRRSAPTTSTTRRCSRATGRPPPATTPTTACRPPRPKASIRGMLQAYDLEPGDVIRVDAGTLQPDGQHRHHRRRRRRADRGLPRRRRSPTAARCSTAATPTAAAGPSSCRHRRRHAGPPGDHRRRTTASSPATTWTPTG